MIIDKDTPPPPPSVGGRPRKYPFADMGVGDSFTVPLLGVRVGGEDQAVARLRPASIAHARRHGGKYIVRVDHESNAARCWRTE